MLKYTENATYVLYLLCDTIWTWEFSRRERPDWDQRIDRFAQHLVDIVRTTNAEEIVIVGHSSGSFLSTEMLARALKLDPALGRHGPRIVLLTSAEISRSSASTLCQRNSASICGCWRSSRRSTGSTARHART